MRADDISKNKSVEIEILDERGVPIKISPFGYARQIGHAVTIDMGDGSTITFFGNGKTKTEYTELPEGHEPSKEPI